MKRIRLACSVSCTLLWLTSAAPALAPAAEAMPPTTSEAPHAASGAVRQFETGLRLAADNKTEAAIAVFARLTRDYPRLPEPHQQLAALHARKGDLQQAVAALRNALRLSVQDSQLQEQLGDLYLQLAARAYREAAHAAPPSPGAQHKYSILQSVNPLPAPTSIETP